MCTLSGESSFETLELTHTAPHTLHNYAVQLSRWRTAGVKSGLQSRRTKDARAGFRGPFQFCHSLTLRAWLCNLSHVLQSQKKGVIVSTACSKTFIEEEKKKKRVVAWKTTLTAHLPPRHGCKLQLHSTAFVSEPVALKLSRLKALFIKASLNGVAPGPQKYCIYCRAYLQAERLGRGGGRTARQEEPETAQFPLPTSHLKPQSAFIFLSLHTLLISSHFLQHPFKDFPVLHRAPSPRQTMAGLHLPSSGQQGMAVTFWMRPCR